MLITKTLRKHLCDKLGMPADATDAAANEFALKAIFDGTLSAVTIKECAKSDVSEAEAKINGMIETGVAKALGDGLTKALAPLLERLGGAAPAPAAQAPQPASGDGVNGDGTIPLASKAIAGATPYSESAPRIKSVVEQFDDTKTAATYDHSPKAWLKHHFGGKRLTTGEDGYALDMPTERQKAIAGAWFKHQIVSSYKSQGKAVPHEFQLTELDVKLFEYAMHECRFVGPTGVSDGNQDGRGWLQKSKLNDMTRKALLDDVLSGGLEAVPIEFDSLAIITPLLTGELLPLVTMRPATRRRIEGFAVGNPTMNWGVADGTTIPVFDTASFVTAFDTVIHPLTGSIELGLDFEADSPVALGDVILDRYGERFREVMDNVIAVGSGVGQPEGVFNATGVTLVGTDNGTGGPATVSDYEALLFGVKKQFRSAAGQRGIFIGTETSYQRVRGIQVGTSDQRRVFGMDHESYTLLNHPYKINESISNSQVGFFCMDRYRMYRRAGLGVRVVTEGKELALANKRLIVVRARVGGQLEQSGAAALTETAKS